MVSPPSVPRRRRSRWCGLSDAPRQRPRAPLRRWMLAPALVVAACTVAGPSRQEPSSHGVAPATACSNERLRYLFTRFFETRNDQDLDGFLALWDLGAPYLQYAENVAGTRVDIRDAEEMKRHVAARFRTGERFTVVRMQLYPDEGATRGSASPVADYVRTLDGKRLGGGIKIICTAGLITGVVHSSE